MKAWANGNPAGGTFLPAAASQRLHIPQLLTLYFYYTRPCSAVKTWVNGEPGGDQDVLAGAPLLLLMACFMAYLL